MQHNAYRACLCQPKPYRLANAILTQGFKLRKSTAWGMDAKACVSIPLSFNEELESLGKELYSLRDEVEKFSREFPHVQNVTKLKRRLRSEIEFLNECGKLMLHTSGQGIPPVSDDPSPADRVPGRDLSSSIQGLKNNLRGMKAELHVARTAPCVVAVSKTVRLVSPCVAGMEPRSTCTRFVIYPYIWNAHNCFWIFLQGKTNVLFVPHFGRPLM
jgi:hypothetical protein